MKRIVAIVVCLLLAAVALPPLWFVLFPQSAPELPPEGRRVEISSRTGVNVIERGEGPTVVLIHGHPGSAYDWRAVMTELARRGFHAIAYDRVGYGRSDGRADHRYTVDANADDLLALLEADHIEQATIVGWSYGGGTALIAARKDHSRIARLVLVASVGPGIENRAQPPAILSTLMNTVGFRWLSYVPPLNRRLSAVLASEAFSPESVTPSYLTLLAANLAAPHTLTSFTSEGHDLDGTTDLDPTSIEVPLLILQGDGDRSVPLNVAKELHRRAEGSQLQIIPRAGHMLPITRSADVAERIATFAR